MLKVKSTTLLLIAAAVWFAAGANIVHIGIEEYALGYVSILNVVLSIAVGLLFWFMVFQRLAAKHTARIEGYGDARQLFVKFFDKKSFVIMAVMMTGGITIRMLHLAPDAFIAIFYTGLGCALTLAGVLFAANYVRAQRAARIG